MLFSTWGSNVNCLETYHVSDFFWRACDFYLRYEHDAWWWTLRSAFFERWFVVAAVGVYNLCSIRERKDSS